MFSLKTLNNGIIANIAQIIWTVLTDMFQRFKYTATTSNKYYSLLLAFKPKWINLTVICYMELTHLGSKASISYTIQNNKTRDFY